MFLSPNITIIQFLSISNNPTFPCQSQDLLYQTTVSIMNPIDTSLIFIETLHLGIMSKKRHLATRYYSHNDQYFFGKIKVTFDYSAEISVKLSHDFQIEF